MTTTHEVTDEKLRSFAKVIGLDRIADRCSKVFLSQLYGCTFGTNILGDTAQIVAEVESLEGVGRRPTRTKPAEAFKKPPLLGLKKKHYPTGGVSSMGRNIILAAGKKKGGVFHPSRIPSFLIDSKLPGLAS